MKTTARAIAVAFAVGACFAPGAASAFTSGSTGADGVFSPTVNATINLPPSGIFNYVSVNIPAGVTVKYVRNTTNTPVVILATGDVTIAGTIDVSGGSSANIGPAGDGALGDDGTPGLGGNGGFDGGRGGLPGSGATSFGGTGVGPGGGGFGTFNGTLPCAGGGGGYGATGGTAQTSGCLSIVLGGIAYGSKQILPLIGGSGGGGGAGGVSLSGSGGGGGGGALLIAASGTVTVSGTINANGGASGSSGGTGNGGTGGGGAGGGIRILATNFTGNGPITAIGGVPGTAGTGGNPGGAGAVGYIRLEAENFNRTSATNPPTNPVTPPGPVFVTGAPALAISSVAGVAAPANPTGNADITLPSSTPNPVTVVFTTTGVPVGNTVQLTVIPAIGTKTSVISPALTGDTTSATASVSVNLPVGPSVLQAQTTYTIVAALGDLLRNFAGNERVERITLVATLGGPSRMKLITVSGKEYDAPAEAMRIAALGG